MCNGAYGVETRGVAVLKVVMAESVRVKFLKFRALYLYYTR